jgi:hypothetical protein
MSPESSLMNSMGRAGKLLRSFKNLFLKKVRRIIFFYLSFLIFLPKFCTQSEDDLKK